MCGASPVSHMVCFVFQGIKFVKRRALAQWLPPQAGLSIAATPSSFCFMATSPNLREKVRNVRATVFTRLSDLSRIQLSLLPL